jgi:hypothetical protein
VIFRTSLDSFHDPGLPRVNEEKDFWIIDWFPIVDLVYLKYHLGNKKPNLG